MDKSQFNLESEWAKLSKEKQDKMNEDCDVVFNLVMFQNKANVRLFQYMYGDQVGLHLFSKFALYHEGSVLSFLNSLDRENRKKTLFILTDPDKTLYSNC